jgi:hypothetical protein
MGSWRWDLDKTLRSIRTPANASKAVKDSAAKAKKFVEAVKRDIGYMIVTYSDHDYVQVDYRPDGTVGTPQSAPYELLQIEKDFVVIDQKAEGSSAKLFFEGNSFYVEVQVGEYIYKDYFTKL